MYSIKPHFCNLEDVGIYAAMVVIQIAFAVVGVLMGNELSEGVNPLAFIVYSNGIGGLVLIPFAFFFEKKKRPATVSLSLLGKFFLLSLSGVCAFQAFLLKGLKDTSPAFASAMPNLAPALIFLMAWALGMEKVDLKSVRSISKILGTLICVCGAVGMSFLRGPALTELWPTWGHSTSVSEPNSVHLVETILYQGDSGNQTRGCLYLITAVIILSMTIILQVETLKKYPAALSLTSITAILGSIQTAVLISILDKGIIPTSWLLDRTGIVAVISAGIAFNAMALPLQLWCLHKRGPVFVTVFSPVSTVCSAILSSLFLGDTLHLGSFMGVILIFVGLYLFLWGKSQDDITHIKISSDEEADLASAEEGEEHHHPAASSEVLDVKTPLIRH